MIAIDMECSSGHVFEGWFDSLESFEEQNVKGLVSCPYCDDKQIRKVLSPVAVRKSRRAAQQGPLPVDYHRLAMEVVNYINENSADVGHKFTSEALKMHFGAVEKRSIRGTATPEEEDTLRGEGVEFFKFPVLKKDDHDKKN